MTLLASAIWLRAETTAPQRGVAGMGEPLLLVARAGQGHVQRTGRVVDAVQGLHGVLRALGARDGLLQHRDGLVDRLARVRIRSLLALRLRLLEFECGRLHELGEGGVRGGEVGCGRLDLIEQATGLVDELSRLLQIGRHVAHAVGLDPRLDGIQHRPGLTEHGLRGGRVSGNPGDPLRRVRRGELGHGLARHLDPRGGLGE